MKIKINKLIQTITAIALLGVLAGCAPSANGPSTGSGTAGTVQDTTEAKSYTLSGLLSFNAGAFPKDFVESKANGERTATSSFTTPTGDPSYTLKAVQGTTTVEGTIKNETTGATYSIVLPSTGTWELTATFLVYDEIICTGQTSITIAENSESTLPAKSIGLKYNPQTNVHEKGCVNLTINTSASNLAKIDWRWVDSAYNGSRLVNGYSNTIENNTESVVFNFESVNPGAYNVELTFADSNGKTIYSCFETINIFAGMVTDTWCGNSTYINDKNEFVFNDTVSGAYTQNQNRLNITDDTTLYYLWSNVPAEANTLDTNAGTPPQTQPGGQVFTSLSSDTTITAPIPGDSTFCFDGTTLYIPPYRYINSYAGYVLDESFDLLSVMNIPENMNVDFPSNTSCVFLDGYLYFLFAIGDYVPENYYIGRYDTVNKTFINTSSTIYSANDPTEKKCPAFTVTHNKDPETQEITGGVIYYAIENRTAQYENPVYIYRKPFKIEKETIQGQGSETTRTSINFITTIENGSNQMSPSSYDLQSFVDSTDMLWYQYSRNLRISDMTVINDNLYVLVYYALFPEMTYGEYYKTGDSGREKLCDSFISTGGIMKFDTSSNAYEANFFVPQAWQGYSGSPGTENKILGFYSEIGCVDDGGEPFSYGDDKNSTDTTVFPVQPPLTKTDSYFYGPRKIIATAEDQITIVDDGGFIELDPTASYNRDLDKLKPINRVVTVDFTSGSFENIIEVGATFSATYSSGYGANCFSPDIIMVGP
jgi:hypothetical protein